MLYGDTIECLVKEIGTVLILILLENALRLCGSALQIHNVMGCLNPYFVGKCSTAKINIMTKQEFLGLNPYFVGKCSTAW